MNGACTKSRWCRLFSIAVVTGTTEKLDVLSVVVEVMEDEAEIEVAAVVVAVPVVVVVIVPESVGKA